MSRSCNTMPGLLYIEANGPSSNTQYSLLRYPYQVVRTHAGHRCVNGLEVLFQASSWRSSIAPPSFFMKCCATSPSLLTPVPYPFLISEMINNSALPDRTLAALADPTRPVILAHLADGTCYALARRLKRLFESAAESLGSSFSRR